MPIYEFKCVSPECGKEFELLVRVSQAENPVACTECGAPDAKKKMSRTSFILSGPGWAKDGYSS